MFGIWEEDTTVRDERDRIMEVVAIFGTVDDRFLGVVCGICWFDRERRYDGGGRGDVLLRDGGNE